MGGRPPMPQGPTTADSPTALSSIWDVFAATPGRVVDGTAPSDGPDQNAHWDRDLDLLRELKPDSVRISLSWTALSGNSADRLLDHYERRVDDLLSAGIAPTLTLTHYDMPLTVMADGGWLNRQTADVFGEYTAMVAARLADRVASWVTVNSPLVHTAFGYGLGIEAPGLTMLGDCLQAGVNQLIGHGIATAALRSAGATRVGIANNHTAVRPASPSPEDRHCAALYSALHNRAFTNPLFSLNFPPELSEFGAGMEFVSEADRALVAQPLDFYGVNYYHPVTVAHAPDNSSIPFTFADPAVGTPIDAFDWPIDAQALTDVLLDLTTQYPNLPPLEVTENGTQTHAGLADEARILFLDAHLAAVAKAIGAGADVRGYQHWSLLDGWEFAEGLSRKMGLVEVDTTSRTRTPRASFGHYRNLIAEHRQRQRPA